MEFILAALLSGFFLFNSQATPGKAEHIMEKALRQQFPTAQTVDVSVEGKRGRNVLRGKFDTVRVDLAGFGRITGLPLMAAPQADKTGHLGRLELQLRDFTFNDLKVESANFAFNDVTYNREGLQKHSLLQIVKSGPASARLAVPVSALESLAAARFKDVQNARFSAHNGAVRVTGKRPLGLLGIAVPFTLTAKPEIRNGNEIWLTEPRVAVENVTGMSIPAGSLIANLNPVYVFDPDRKMPFRIQGTGIQARDNRLELSADLTFLPAPQAGP